MTTITKSKIKTGRAWNNGLKLLDELFSWMYEKDILTKTDKNEKDKIFRGYYRYYNDGDFPRILNSSGVNQCSGDQAIEEALEERIETFMKTILKKYSGKYNRKDFRRDNRISKLETLQSVISDDDSHGLITYWLKEIKVENTEFKKHLKELKVAYK